MKNFFPKFELLNSGCGLSVSAAYLRVFTVSWGSVFFLRHWRPWSAVATVGKLLTFSLWGCPSAVPKHTWSQGVSHLVIRGQAFVEVGGERSTMAQRAVELIDTSCWDT